LFLTTALPTRLLTEKPYRDPARSLGRALIISRAHDHERPSARTCAYCCGLVRWVSPAVTSPPANVIFRLRSAVSDL
jgi:hypothetical protein